MSGRRKGLDAERAAVRALRAELGAGFRVLRVARDRDDPADVDAVILRARGGAGWSVEVQIRAWKDAPRRALGWARAFVRGRAVLMYRGARGPWWVTVAAGDGFATMDLAAFVRCVGVLA